MNLRTLATLTEPARIRAAVAAVLAVCASLGVTLPFDLPGWSEAVIAVLAVLVPIVQGEATRRAVISPATHQAALTGAAAGRHEAQED